jgi:type IV pilus assembly protein PilW
MPVRANMLTLRQAGLTLVELLVAMVLMLLVAIATVAMYNVSSSSYRTVDANQELQDSARFAMEIIGQAARSAGYQDRTGPPTTEKVYVDQVFGPTIRETWRVEGRNGQTLSGGNSLTYSTSGVVNSSDALVVRFFGANLPDPANPSVAKLSGGKPVPDGSMIDCSGRALPYPVGSADVGVSAFFVKVLNGEPELYCKSWNSNAATPAFSDTQVVRGVETLQIVYGVDTNTDEVADSWLERQCLDLGRPGCQPQLEQRGRHAGGHGVARACGLQPRAERNSFRKRSLSAGQGLHLRKHRHILQPDRGST